MDLGYFRRRVGFCLASLLLIGLVPSQLAAQQSTDKPPHTLRVTTRLVLVDVVVTDQQGKLVEGLAPTDFTLLENGRPQKISVFDFEPPQQEEQRAEPGRQPPRLPPLVATNRPEYHVPAGPITILLLDGLNTSISEQAVVQYKVQSYISSQLRPGQPTALLTLQSRLQLLQGFTTDPQLLLAGIKRFRPKQHLYYGSGSEENPERNFPRRSGQRGELARNLRFEAEQAAVLRDTRVRATLEALQAIARTVRGLPGRKKLIWVSEAFPIVFNAVDQAEFEALRSKGTAPGSTWDVWPDFLRSYSGEVERTTNLLTDARIAVYPIDARSLKGVPLGDASRDLRSIQGATMTGQDLLTELRQEMDEIGGAQHAMDRIAAETGGRASYNRNDIDNAVAESAEDASAYYTLGYYPEDKEWKGEFRRIAVKVSQAEARVRHRTGYYALEPATPADEDAHERQRRLVAMLWNPMPVTAVLFWSKLVPSPPVQPKSTTVQFLVDAKTLFFVEDSEGQQQYDVDFLAAAVSAEDELIELRHQRFHASLPPERFAQVKERGLPFQLELALPAGSAQVRMAVRDNHTGLLGTATVSLSP